MSVTRSHNLSVGIVGLPNSGKSTIFNALTQAAVPAENYPFCTIDKNVGVVKIPDERLENLADHYNAEKTVHSAVKFVDIAGLVKGASKGEGLGNQFLSHIREVDAIMYVLRAFHSEKIAHVYERVSPADDLKIVRSELILRDIETVEKKLEELKSHAKSGMNDELEMQIGCLEGVLAGFSDEIPAINVELNEEEREFLGEMWLLTNKPAMYVLNVKEGVDEGELDGWICELQQTIPDSDENFVIKVDCKMESDLSELSGEEKEELLSVVDSADYKGIDGIIDLAFRRLDLITFFTGNEKEVNAWTIKDGANVKDAAGVIHSDLAERFVAAEVVNVEKMLESGGWNASKDLGIIKNVSREYEVIDGDYVVILANPG